MKIVGKIIKHCNKELRITQHIILLTPHSLTETLIILLPGPDPVPWQKGAAYHPPHSSLHLRDPHRPRHPRGCRCNDKTRFKWLFREEKLSQGPS
jgi:hypothetical protein